MKRISRELPGEQLLPPQWYFWDRVVDACNGMIIQFGRVWGDSTPSRPNQEQEAKALWACLRLNSLCHSAHRQTPYPVLPLSPAHFDPEARFEVQAALEALPRLMPFYQQVGLSQAGETSDTEAWIRESDRFAEPWHKWLWSSHSMFVELDTSAGAHGDYGDSSLVRIAAAKLGHYIQPVVGRGRASESPY